MRATNWIVQACTAEALTAPMPEDEATAWAMEHQPQFSLPLTVVPDLSGTVVISRQFLISLVYHAGTGDDMGSWDYAETAEKYLRRHGLPVRK